jgi:signal transduction histidine kinase
MVLPGLVAALGLAEIAFAGYRPRAPTLAAFVLVCAVLVLARTLPLAVPPLVGAGYAVAAASGANVVDPASWLIVIALACFLAGFRARSRAAALVSAVTAAVLAYLGLDVFTAFPANIVFGLTLAIGGWGLGAGVRDSLQRSHQVGVRAERERLAAAMAGERAVTAVREQLAVEIPDVLAHALGAMVVQAGVAADQVRAGSPLAGRTLAGVAQSGRDALVQTGAVLHALRSPRAASPPAVTPGPGERAETSRPSDAVLPGLIGLVLTAEVLVDGDRPILLTIASGLLAAGVLCWRRRFALLMPVAVVGIGLVAIWLGVSSNGPAASMGLYILAFFAAGRYVSRRLLTLGAASVALAVGMQLVSWRERLTPDAVLMAGLIVLPWLSGVVLRSALERARDLAATAERHQLAGEVDAERAAAAERTRVARGVHDLLADSLHVMVVQATLGSELVLHDPAGAAAAVGRVQRTGQAALERLGRLMELIRGLGGTDPQPRVCDLPELTERFADAGLGIDLDLDGVGSLPPAVEVSAYHIVSEALTNALKHSPRSRVRIRLARECSRLDVEVRNGPPGAPPGPAVPSGHGLIGLRERVLAFGGSLEAGPTGDGGFLLSATMPMAGPA